LLSNIVAIICGVLTPYMLNPTAWNWANYAGFFWVSPKITEAGPQRLMFLQAGICFLCIIYTYFRVPEPAGRSFAELDLLFERGVGARKFATTNVDVFDAEIDPALMEKYKDQIAIAHMEKRSKV
jgi:MFS transporter, SP family, general alpha glucoside:H+ symporter